MVRYARYSTPCWKTRGPINSFISSHGFFGFTEDWPRCGDEIVVPFGSDVPIIIRRVPPTDNKPYGHTLIGACDVCDVMSMELLDLYDAGKVEAKTYRLG
jgi:hypothetical protein